MSKTVLVIEKDEDILHIITKILAEQNFQVIASRTEDDMLDKISEIKPHAIILDIINPTKAGTKLCNEIKASPAMKHIPVIVLSTHFDVKAFSNECADEVVSKPFDIDELIKTVKKQVIA